MIKLRDIENKYTLDKIYAKNEDFIKEFVKKEMGFNGVYDIDYGDYQIDSDVWEAFFNCWNYASANIVVNLNDYKIVDLNSKK